METDLAKRTISELWEKGVCEKITFHVMGEPTLHRDFFEILQHARNENVKIGLTTNGASLGREIGRRLIDFDLHQLDISLQTPDEQSYCLRQAGALSFDNYLSGILNFFSSYKKHHPNTIFKFRFLNTRFLGKDMKNQIGSSQAIYSTRELRKTFRYWADQIYDILGIETPERLRAMRKINKLVSYKWNVVEIFPRVFFETYVLINWGNAFGIENIRDAWAGTCFGMRDHFGILYNGDVILCCIDFDGNTTLGNLHDASLEEILSSDTLENIVDGFKRYRLVHPYCKICLGSTSFLSWLFKPVTSIIGLHVLKPFFYKHIHILE